MKFKSVTPERPVHEEFLSEDKNFRLCVNNSAGTYSKHVISLEHSSILPGYGSGMTKREAMENARQSILEAIDLFQERAAQILVMIEEDTEETEN